MGDEALRRIVPAGQFDRRVERALDTRQRSRRGCAVVVLRVHGNSESSDPSRPASLDDDGTLERLRLPLNERDALTVLDTGELAVLCHGAHGVVGAEVAAARIVAAAAQSLSDGGRRPVIDAGVAAADGFAGTASQLTAGARAAMLAAGRRIGTCIEVWRGPVPVADAALAGGGADG